MSKLIQILAGASALALAVVHQARADVQIVPPDQPVAGQSQLVWAQAFWQWVLGVPSATNPLLDATGVNAGVNNNGPVFFLAGNTGGATARTIDVPYGKPVFLPVVNVVFAGIDLTTGNYDPSPCPSPLTAQCAVQQISAFIKKARKMEVEIDGVVLHNGQIKGYRQASTSLFAVSLPDDNIFGVPVQNYNQCCARQPLWAEDGYWITLGRVDEFWTDDVFGIPLLNRA